MIQKKTILISAMVFIISLAIILLPTITNVLGVSGNTTTFNVTVTVNGGSPTITNVEAISDSPNEGTTKTVYFFFNATHPNGVANIPANNAVVKVNQSGVTLTSSACTVQSTSGITNRFNCSITLNYYNLPGAWTINATITDLASNSVTNTTKTFTVGNTYGIVLKTTSIGFAGTPGAMQPMSNQPQQVNNTGNSAFNQINLTAFDLKSGTNFIGAGNATANTTDGSGAGHTLINNTAITLSGSSLAVQGQRDMYLYMNIPAGTANGTYTSVSDWVVTLS